MIENVVEKHAVSTREGTYLMNFAENVSLMKVAHCRPIRRLPVAPSGMAFEPTTRAESQVDNEGLWGPEFCTRGAAQRHRFVTRGLRTLLRGVLL